MSTHKGEEGDQNTPNIGTNMINFAYKEVKILDVTCRKTPRERGEKRARKEAFPPGLTFWKFRLLADNQCLLELTHRGPADGASPGESKWIPITKKVYWPPTGTTAAAQSHNGQNGPNQQQPPLQNPGAKSEAGSVISAHSGKRKREKDKKVGKREESKLH